MRLDLKGRAAVVTGATGTIGRATALALAASGARVLIHGRTHEGTEATAARAQASGYEVATSVGDLSSDETFDAIVAAAVRAFGAIDVLVNNAALTSTYGDFIEASDESVDNILDINLRATLLLTERIVEVMRPRARGAIVNLSSVGGVPARALTQRRVRHLKGSDRRHDAGAGGRTRSVRYPGERGCSRGRDRRAARKRGADLPLRRGGTPDDIAGAVVFLASDAASFITGQIL